MKHMESKVVLKTKYFVYEFSSEAHLKEWATSQINADRFADTIYDRNNQRFTKCRRMSVTELNEMLELTRG
jgi:hypothetical protein